MANNATSFAAKTQKHPVKPVFGQNKNIIIKLSLFPRGNIFDFFQILFLEGYISFLQQKKCKLENFLSAKT